MPKRRSKQLRHNPVDKASENCITRRFVSDRFHYCSSLRKWATAYDESCLQTISAPDKDMLTLPTQECDYATQQRPCCTCWRCRAGQRFADKRASDSSVRCLHTSCKQLAAIGPSHEADKPGVPLNTRSLQDSGRRLFVEVILQHALLQLDA